MSPLAGVADAVFASPALATTVSTGDAIARSLGIALGATMVVFPIGLVLVAGASSFTRTISDDVADRPDLSFAAGFVCFFGLLVVGASPLIVGTLAGLEAGGALTLLVSLPGLFLWGLLLIVGSTLGAVAVGDRIASRVGGDSPSLARALVTGTALFSASLLVPVFGALVAMGLATVAVGAVVRRRFDIDGQLFEGEDEPDRDPTAVAATEDRGTETEARSADPWGSTEDESTASAPVTEREPDGESTETVRERADSDATAPRGSEWEWDTDDASRERSEEDGDENRSLHRGNTGSQ